MKISEKTVLRHVAAKPRHVFPMSLISLMVAGMLGTSPAFAANGTHCVHTIDYSKVSASELEMLYRDIDVSQFANKGATGGKCLATIDYSKLSMEELEMQYRDIDVHHYAKDSATGGNNVATIDYNKLSATELERLYQDINLAVDTDVTSNESSMTALADK